MASTPPHSAQRPDPRWAFLAPPHEPGELGRLGPYRVLRLLGQGGMGLVFQAEDVQLHRPVALKVMRPDFAIQERARERFLREAQAAAALKHDHIVTIYQVGEESGVPFLAMEFLAGKSLEDWLQPDRRASLPETLTIARQIARGLAAAHGVGLIHRDIKPANLWLEAPRGRVKILDFGLARRSTSQFTALTQDGALIGTPAFMAPEQARGERVDHRCDLFSLGCVLYRMVTGRLPFPGDTVYAVLGALLEGTPPAVRTLNPQVPPRLEELIHRLLAKSPDDRPASAQEVLDELGHIARERDLPPGTVPGLARTDVTTARPARTSVTTTRTKAVPPVVRRRSWMAGLLGLMVLAGASLFLAFGLPRNREPIPQAPEQLPAVNPPGPPEEGQGEPIELLPLVDVKRDAKVGKWKITQEGPFSLRGRPVHGDERPLFALVLPWEPPPEYRLRLTVNREAEQPGFLSVELSSGSSRFGIVFDAGPRQNRFFTGVGIADGQPLFVRPDARVGRVLPAGLPINLVCTVEAKKVTVEANGQEIYRWLGDLSRLSRRHDLPEQPLVLVGTNRGGFTFEKIVLEPLGPSAGQALPDHQ